MAGFDKVSGMFGAALSCLALETSRVPTGGTIRSCSPIPITPTLSICSDLLAHNQGQTEGAVGHIRRAIAVRDGNPEFHHNLGNILKEAGRQDEAAECYQRALDLKPDLVGTLYNLGTLCQDLGRPK